MLSTYRRIVWAVVMAQLVERSLPLPGDPGSNPAFEKSIIYLLLSVEKTKNIEAVKGLFNH